MGVDREVEIASVGASATDPSHAIDVGAATLRAAEPTGGDSVESWLADLASAPSLSLGPSIGEEIAGEFRIERRVGEGGMGVVYLAWHLVLDRRVAIKLHRAATRAAASRLLREARAVAKVEHDNVLVVYEVGTWNDHVFVAMEYIEGWTARQWVDAAPRSWREVVALYIEAGRGLAAAHAAGLVHRDFKPDNVLIGRVDADSDRRGRVRVADFGLARAVGEISRIEITQQRGEDPTLSDDIVGSPAYMAPEQFRSGDVDARADQFAFCVALFEGVFRRRPYEASTLVGLAVAITEGRIQEPDGAAVPQHVRRVLRRGLSSDPHDRFPDMGALLDALSRDPTAAKRRWLSLAAVIGVTGALTWAAVRPPDPGAGCTETPAAASWWTDDANVSLRESLLASGRSFAADSHARIDASLRSRGEQAEQSLARVCQAVHVEGSRSLMQLAAHRECLAQRGREQAALLEVLGRGDPEITDRAVAATEGLTPIERCDFATGDDDLADVDASMRPQIDAALELVAKVGELRSAGRYQEGFELGAPRIDEVAALGKPRILAMLHLELAYTLEKERLFDQASAQLRSGIAAAVRAGADLVAAELAIEGVFVDGSAVASRERGEHWAVLAEAWLERGGAPGFLQRQLLVNRGMAHRAVDRFEHALADHLVALALLERDAPDQRYARAGMRAVLGMTYVRMGRHPEALPLLRAAVRDYEASVGEAHPTTANAWNLLGGVQLELGDYAGAEVSLTHAVEVGERALGPGSARVVEARANLGGVYVFTGRLADGVAIQARALADLRATGSKPERNHVTVMSNLAVAQAASGDGDGARELHAEATTLAGKIAGERSLLFAKLLVTEAGLWVTHDPPAALERAERGSAIMATLLPASAPDRIQAASIVATAKASLDRCDDAVPELERARGEIAALMGPTHPDIIGVLVGLGRCNVLAGHFVQAIEQLDGAAAVADAAGIPQLAHILEWRARARLGHGERELARSLHADMLASAKRTHDAVAVARAAAVGRELDRAR